MAKNGSETGGYESVGKKSDAEGYEQITGVWARGMVDGESVEGRYLGYDTIVNDEGQHRKRHRFELADASKAPPTAVNGVDVIFGATGLDIDLRAAKLGRMTLVTRIGEQDGRRSIVYDVKQKGPVTADGIIGRQDDPIDRTSSEESGGSKWRGRKHAR